MAQAVILIVEDEALAGMELRETLERLGYSVPEVLKRGEDVPEAIVVHKPDLILMDIRLKGFQDGIETAYMVGGEFDVPFIFLSAYSDDETLSRALGTRAYGYLVKPYDEKTLRTTLELALRRSREYRERGNDDWYKNALSRFPRPVFLTDAYGRISFSNDAAKGNVPGAGDGRVGTALHILFAEPAVVTDLLAEAGSLKGGVAKKTLAFKSSDARATLEVSAFRDDDGRATGFVVLAFMET
ncbi:MAG: response regulator [Spirochaetales bacterium]|nr:response regulator [Spirochaetales bacterium]MBP7263689.1 response regulator [Spirochaetia bacterium]